MSIVRVGTTKRYSDGWDAIFGKKKAGTRKSPASPKKARKKTTKRKK